jgi:protein tyrosine phosphatase
MQITLISCESLMKNLIRRKLMIIEDEKELHEVIQLNYLSWPDHGAPEVTDFQIIRKLIDFTQEHHQRPVDDNSKIVFHCSAGIGRTGTMLAIYNIIESLKILLDKPSEDESNGPRISIFGVVRRLREQRYCMVQTSSQYEFIY